MKYCLKFTKNSVTLLRDSEETVTCVSSSLSIRAHYQLSKQIKNHKPYIPYYVIFSYINVAARNLKNLLLNSDYVNQDELRVYIIFWSRNRSNYVKLGLNEDNELIIEKCFNEIDATTKINAEIEGSKLFNKFYNISLRPTQVSSERIRMNYVHLQRQLLSRECVRGFHEKRPKTGTMEFSVLLNRDFGQLDDLSEFYRKIIIDKYGHYEVDLTFQHGDFNPSNVCINGDKIELIDFEYFKTSSVYWLDYFRYSYSIDRFYKKLSPEECLNSLKNQCDTDTEHATLMYLILEELIRRRTENIPNEYEQRMLALI